MPVKLATPVAGLEVTPVAPTTSVKVAASRARSCTVATGVVAVPQRRIDEADRAGGAGADRDGGREVGKRRGYVGGDRGHAEQRRVVGRVGALPAPVVAVPATPPATWVNPIVALMVAPGASVGATPVKLATPVPGL